MSNSTLDLLEGPAGPPPPGVTPNFVNPPNQTVASYVVAGVCMALTTFVVVIRIYAKTYCLKDVRLPDILTFIAFGFQCGFIYALVDCIYDVGFVVDVWNYQLKTLPAFLYPSYLMAILYSLVLLFLKSAILLDWCRILVPQGTRNFFWWTCQILAVLNALFYLAGVFSWVFSCSPVNMFWTPWLNGECVNMLVLDVINGVFNLIVDLIAFFLPQRVIWNLNLPVKKRVGVSLMFGIGLITCIIAVVRIPYTVRAYLSNSITYDLGILDLLSLGEVTCAFIVFCAPSSLVVFSRIPGSTLFPSFKSWFSSFSSKLRSTEEKSANSWTSSALSSPNSRKDYSQINQSKRSREGSAFDNSSTVHQVELDQFRFTNDEAPILRTVDFTASAGYEPHAVDDQYSRQHPWANKSRNPQSNV